MPHGLSRFAPSLRLRRAARALCVVLGAVALVAPDLSALSVENRGTEHAIDIDGAFTGGVSFAGSEGTPLGEWSDVAPLAFVSQSPRLGTALRQALPATAGVDVLFYPVVQVEDGPPTHLYVLIAASSRTTALGAAGAPPEVAAEIVLPFLFRGSLRESFTLRFRASARTGLRIVYDVKGDGTDDGPASDLGIDAAIGFGASPLDRRPHLVLELRLPLAPRGLVGGGRALGVDGAEIGVPNGPDVAMDVHVRADGDPPDVPRGGADPILTIAASAAITALSTAPLEGPAGFRRGETNGDSVVDIADVTRTLECLFTNGECPVCFDAADVNDDGTVDLSDAVHELLWLFAQGTPPPNPGPWACGSDPTPDPLPPCPDLPDSC